MLPDIAIDSIVSIVGTLITAAATIYAAKMGKNAKEAIEYARSMFGSREQVEKRSPLEERVAPGLGIKEIRIANFTSNAWLNEELVDAEGLASRSVMVSLMQELVTKENIGLTMVITAPGTEASKEAIRSEKVINVNTTYDEREKLFYCAYHAIRKNIEPGGYLHDSFTKKDFKYRLTEVAMPYGIFQVIYKDGKKNHIKLDLYSPYISRENKRRSIFIYEDKNPEDYQYFSEEFDKMFNKAISPAEEKKMEDIWLAKAEEYYK